jgi:hypothetical protein
MRVARPVHQVVVGDELRACWLDSAGPDGGARMRSARAGLRRSCPASAADGGPFCAPMSRQLHPAAICLTRRRVEIQLHDGLQMPGMPLLPGDARPISNLCLMPQGHAPGRPEASRPIARIDGAALAGSCPRCAGPWTGLESGSIRHRSLTDRVDDGAVDGHLFAPSLARRPEWPQSLSGRR